MNDQPRKYLCMLIQDHGQFIFNESTFGSLLMDYFQGGFKKERNVLLESIREDIPKLLLTKSDTIPYDILSTQLIQKLVHCGFADELAIWAVETWGIAFGIIPKEFTRNIKSNQQSPVKNPKTLPAIFQIKETDILAFTPVQFKLHMKELFEQLGYSVRLMPTSNNFIDFVISGNKGDIVVVTKKYSKSVSDTVVQRILAAKKYYNANKTLVITTSSFTDSAVSLAKANNVELWSYNTLIKIVRNEGIDTSFETDVLKYLINNLYKYCNPEKLDACQIITFSIKMLEVAIEVSIQHFRVDDGLYALAMVSNLHQKRKISLILELLKKFNLTPTYDEVSNKYNVILEKNRNIARKPGDIFEDFNQKEHYEKMNLTISYTCVCPLCENPIYGTPIDKEVYDPSKTYHAIIKCLHCSFHDTIENIISDSLKEKILKEAATHTDESTCSDLFERIKS